MKGDKVFMPIFALAFIVGAGIPGRAETDPGTPPLSRYSPQNAPISSRITPELAESAGQITTDRNRYVAGQSAVMKFTVTNRTQRDIGYNFSTAKQFDVYITDSRGREFWRWSRDRMYAQRLTYFNLPSGRSKAFRADWNGRGLNGRPLAPGLYTVHAELTFDTRPAIVGGAMVNNNPDPNNMGMPTRSPADNGAVRQTIVTPPVTASKSIVIVSSPNRSRY